MDHLIPDHDYCGYGPEAMKYESLPAIKRDGESFESILLDQWTTNFLDSSTEEQKAHVSFMSSTTSSMSSSSLWTGEDDDEDEDDEEEEELEEDFESSTSLVIFSGVDADYRCGECEKKFVHEKSYKSHMKSHQGAFRCETCLRSFSNVANLNVHRRIHTGLTPYKCELCSQPFRTSGMYKRHLCKAHPRHPVAQRMLENMVDYVCPNCGRILKTLGSYHKHVARHDVQNLHVCQLCHVDCFTHEAYQSHQKRCHEGEKGKTIEEKLERNRCHICNTCFYSMMALWNHATLYHAPFNGLPCHICGKVSTTRNAYMTHRRSHMGTKELVCHVCQRRFNKASHLQDHIRVHLEDYTYKCPVCNKGFLRPKNLKTHLLAKHRPTIDKCCVRTLQRRKKRALMGQELQPVNRLHKRRILRLGEDGIQMLQNETLEGLASNLTQTCVSEDGSQTVSEDLSQVTNQEHLYQTVEACDESADADTTDNLSQNQADCYEEISDEEVEEDPEEDSEEDYRHSEDDSSSYEDLNQVSAFPEFDWKRLTSKLPSQTTTTSTTKTLSKSNPYVDLQGQPLFSKSKPTPITEKLVALAKDQAKKRRHY